MDIITIYATSCIIFYNNTISKNTANVMYKKHGLLSNSKSEKILS